MELVAIGRIGLSEAGSLPTTAEWRSGSICFEESDISLGAGFILGENQGELDVTVVDKLIQL